VLSPPSTSAATPGVSALGRAPKILAPAPTSAKAVSPASRPPALALKSAPWGGSASAPVSPPAQMPAAAAAAATRAPYRISHDGGQPKVWERWFLCGSTCFGVREQGLKYCVEERWFLCGSMCFGVRDQF
jgi:hypothetical protein